MAGMVPVIKPMLVSFGADMVVSSSDEPEKLGRIRTPQSLLPPAPSPSCQRTLTPKGLLTSPHFFVPTALPPPKGDQLADSFDIMEYVTVDAVRVYI